MAIQWDLHYLEGYIALTSPKDYAPVNGSPDTPELPCYFNLLLLTCYFNLEGVSSQITLSKENVNDTYNALKNVNFI